MQGQKLEHPHPEDANMEGSSLGSEKDAYAIMRQERQPPLRGYRVPTRIRVIGAGLVTFVVLVVVVVAPLSVILNKGPKGASTTPHGPPGAVVVDPTPDVASQPTFSSLITGEVTSVEALYQSIPVRLVNILAPSEQIPKVLSGQDALTFQFSRAVIALGSNWDQSVQTPDANLAKVAGVPPVLWSCENNPPSAQLPVPGKLRWVTTSILRFDPDTTWASDRRCTVQVNPALVAFDGTPVSAPSLKTLSFRTQPLSMSLASISSQQAANVTDGTWQYQLDGAPELPPDGKMLLYFSSPINPAYLQRALYVTRDGTTQRLGVTVAPCDADEQACRYPTLATVTVNTALSVDTSYKLILPAGSVVSEYSGPIASPVTIQFTGLVGFRIPWSKLVSSTTTVSHVTQRLWLRHGLAPNTDIGLLRSCIVITPPPVGDWTLEQTGRISLVIRGRFLPHSTYTFSVKGNPNILDGFGLPLLDHSSPTYNTATVSPLLGSPEPFVLTADNNVSRIPLWLLRGGSSTTQSTPAYLRPFCAARNTTAAPVPSDQVLPALRHYYVNCGSSVHTVPDYFASVNPSSIQRAGPQALNEEVGIHYVNASALFGLSGLALVQVSGSVGPWESGCRQSTTEVCKFYSRSNLAIVAAMTADSSLVWATDLLTGSSVGNVQIRAYRIAWATNANEVSFFATATTDSTGLATLPAINGQYHLVAIGPDGSVAQLGGYWWQYSVQLQAILGDLLIDRTLYRIGDTVNIKGYVRSLTRKVAVDSVTLSFPWSNDYTQELTVPVSQNFGSFSAVVVVPTNATFGQKYLSARNGDVYITNTFFTIADPRVPTGLLELSTDNEVFILSHGELPLSIATKSYTGVYSRNTSVKLTWNIGSATGIVPLELPEGYLKPFLFTLPPTLVQSLQSAGKSDAGGTTLSLVVEWFSPARELLIERLAVPVRLSTWQATLTSETPVSEILPGYPFRISLSLDIPLPSKYTVDSPPPVEAGVFALGEKEAVEAPVLWSQSSPAVGLSLSWTSLAGLQSQKMVAQAEITLQSIGKFAIVFHIVDDTGISVFPYQVVGKSQLEWQKAPLTTLVRARPSLDRTEYATTDIVNVLWNCPFANASAILRWGKSSFAGPFALQVGANSLPASITPTDCPAGCDITMMVAAPVQTEVTLPVAIPVSTLFSTALPVALTHTLAVNVKQTNHSLAVELTLPQGKIVRPDSDTILTVKVPPNQVSEVAVWVVDLALLDVLPRGLPSELSLFTEPRQNIPVQTQATHDRTTSMQNLESSIHSLASRLQLDPWYDQEVDSWSVRAKTWPTALDQDARFVINCTENWLTTVPWSARWYSACSATTAIDNRELSDSVAGGGAGGAGGGAAMPTNSSKSLLPDASPSARPATVAVRSTFVATALFVASVTPDANGVVRIPFHVPSNIGTWAVRAVAITSGQQLFGAAEDKLIAKRTVSLNPSLPRIVRAGDQFQAGCTVVSDTDASVGISVSVSTTNASSVEIVGSRSVSLKIGKDVVTEVLWHFICNRVGTAQLTFTAYLSDEAVDSFEASLPALGQQDPVYMATSFAVTAATDWVEGLGFPKAISGSGTLGITAGVGRLPTVRSVSQGIWDTCDRELLSDWLSAESLLAEIAAVVALNRYTSDNFTAVAIGRMNRALNDLYEYTDASMGLQYVALGKQPRTWMSATLNGYGLRLLSLIPMSCVSSANLNRLNEMKLAWRYGLTGALSDTYSNWRAYGGPQTWWNDLALAYLALGKIPRLPDMDSVSGGAMSFDNLLDHISELNLASQAMVARTISEAGSTATAHELTVATALRQGLFNRLRVQGRTAYVALASHSAGIDTNAVALLSLLAQGSGQRADPLLEKVANYLAELPPTAVYAYYTGGSPRTAGLRLLALSEYDSMRGASSPNLDLQVASSDGTSMLRSRFDRAGLPPVSRQISWEALGTPAQPLRFYCSGRGEASVTLGMSFVPAQASGRPVYFGLFVEKVIALRNSTSNSLDPLVDLDSLVPGQIVHVSVQITTPDDLASVLVTDLLPAGLEAIDPNLQSAPAPVYQGRNNAYASKGIGFSSYAWYDPESWSFPTKEVRKDRVTCLANSMWAGTHTCSYDATVVTSGKFQLPPAKAVVLSQAEVMGLSGSGTITVLPRSM